MRLSFPRAYRMNFFWREISPFNYFLCNLFTPVSVYDRCRLFRYCFPISNLNQLDYIVLVVVDIDLDKLGWLSKSLLWKSAPNEFALIPEKPVLFDEKKSLSSNKLWVRNNPPPILVPIPSEKKGSLSKEPNPLLPNPDEFFFFYFLLPKNPLKKSSSKEFSSKKCLKMSSAWWKSKLGLLNAE